MLLLNVSPGLWALERLDGSQGSHCRPATGLYILEVVCAHLLIAAVTLQALEALICKFLTGIEILGAALAVHEVSNSIEDNR